MSEPIDYLESVAKDASSRPTTWTWPIRYRPWGILALFALVAITYGAGAQLALSLISESGLQAVFFIPAGITIAFLLRLPRRLWWVVLLGAGVAEFIMDVNGGLDVGASFGFVLANTVEPLVGATILTATCGVIDLSRRLHVLWFMFGAVLIAPAVGAGIGAGTVGLFGGEYVPATFAQWWLGDSLGVILLGSAILVWGSSKDKRSVLSASGALLIIGSVSLTLTIFSLTDLPIMFSVLIGVVVGGAVFGVRAVAITALAIAFAVAVRITVEGETLIIGLTQGEALVLIKLQMGVFALAGLLIAAEAHEGELATRLAAKTIIDAETLEHDRRIQRDIASQIQRSLLPDKLLTRRGIDVAARYESASEVLEVGGDWYDTIELRGGRIGMVVGDIVGHGVEAMISMGRLRTALTALAIHNDDPALLLTELDAFVGGPDGTSYATVFYGIVDVDNRQIRYSSAGHPPGLLVTSDRTALWLDQGQGEPLYGIPSRRQEASAIMGPGSCLILYSDGLVERRGESLSVGLDRLEELALEIASQRPDEICEELFDRLTRGGTRDDDVVLLVMKTAMDPGEYHRVFPAEPSALRKIRSSLRSWIAARGIPSAVGDDLLLAVGEAASNSARHAYRDAFVGDVTLRVTLVDGVINVEVSDSGRWREPLDEDAYPGLGTEIIQSVTEDLRVVRSGRGTLVGFRLPIHASDDTGGGRPQIPSD